MKEWFCCMVNMNYHTFDKVLQECEDIDNSGYKVEQIVYVESEKQYQIFYSKKKKTKEK